MGDRKYIMKIKITNMCLALCAAFPLVAGMTGCAGDRYSRSTGEYIDDKGLNMRVSSA